MVSSTGGYLLNSKIIPRRVATAYVLTSRSVSDPVIAYVRCIGYDIIVIAPVDADVAVVYLVVVLRLMPVEACVGVIEFC